MSALCILLLIECVILAETENLLSRVYKGSIGMMMSTLVKQRDLTREEIRELHDILEGLEGRDGERENK